MFTGLRELLCNGAIRCINLCGKCIKKNRIECRGVYSPGSRLGSFGIWRAFGEFKRGEAPGYPILPSREAFLRRIE